MLISISRVSLCLSWHLRKNKMCLPRTKRIRHFNTNFIYIVSRVGLSFDSSRAAVDFHKCIQMLTSDPKNIALSGPGASSRSKSLGRQASIITFWLFKTHDLITLAIFEHNCLGINCYARGVINWLLGWFLIFDLTANNINLPQYMYVCMYAVSYTHLTLPTTPYV